MMTWSKWLVAGPGVSMVLVALPVFAQPVAGDVFREYRYTCIGCQEQNGVDHCASCSAGDAVRVGPCGSEAASFCADKGTCQACDNITLSYTDGQTYPHAVDIDGALRAEVVVEKVLCHDDTTGLRISFNDHDWIPIPVPPGLPNPPESYQHHIYPVVPVPLSDLNHLTNNSFRMEVDYEGWWPQNLVNGLTLRVYYDPANTPHPTGSIVAPVAGGVVGISAQIRAEVTPSPGRSIQQVDFIGFYEDVNWEGDGVYQQWHYIYDHGELLMHLGTATSDPFQIVWDTSWVPDQPGAMKVRARIIDDEDLTYVTDEVGNLTLDRGGDYSVALSKPYNIPTKWVTRNSGKGETFDLAQDPTLANDAQLVWCSWSPCYANGVLINGTEVFDNEGPCYHTYHHRVTLADMSPFQLGANDLTTPKVDGSGKHGMEVNFPGIMVLVRYGEPGPVTSPTVSFAAPVNDSIVSGLVPVQLTASDPDGTVQSVTLDVGHRSSSSLTATPYETDWDTTALYDGTWALGALATDDQGLSGAATITVTVDNQQTVLLVDDFEDGNGARPTWDVWTGSWSVESGAYRQADNADNCFAVAGDSTWTNYGMEMVVRMEQAGTEGTGPMVRVRDPDNFYLFELDAGQNNARIWCRAGGVYTLLAEATLSELPTVNTPHRVRMEVEGSALRGYLDGWLVIETTDDTIDSGAIGLNAGVATQFDQVVVKTWRGPDPGLVDGGDPDGGPPGAASANDNLLGSCGCRGNGRDGAALLLLGLLVMLRRAKIRSPGATRGRVDGARRFGPLIGGLWGRPKD